MGWREKKNVYLRGGGINARKIMLEIQTVGIEAVAAVLWGFGTMAGRDNQQKVCL